MVQIMSLGMKNILINNDKIEHSKISSDEIRSCGYIDFLINVYKDRFNSYKFRDRAEIGRNLAWEYLNNPEYGKDDPLIWVAKIGNKYVGQFCLMPV